MKYYVVYNKKDNTFFDVPFKSKRIANYYCNFLANRDNIDYQVQERILLIGIVDYKDNEVLEALKNV